MKKTKIMLVAGTLILAAAGAMASKVIHAPSTYYYSTGAGCQTVQVPFDCIPGGPNCNTIIEGSPTQLYLTTDDSGNCLTELRPDEGFK